jgi:hypothetical protein
VVVDATFKYGLSDAQAYEWAQKYECLKLYISKQNSIQVKRKAALRIYIYLEWAKKQPKGPQSPDELLQCKSGFGGTQAEKLLDTFVTAEDIDIPDSVRWLILQNIRGFYRDNYRAVEKAAGKYEYNYKKNKRSLTAQQRFNLYKSCYNPQQKALVLTDLCSAMACESLSKLQWFRFEPDWMQENTPHISLPPEIIKGHGRGKYRGVRQETFITPECKTALIEYRNWFSKTFNWHWKDDDHVFLSIRDNIGEPLKYTGILRIFQRIRDRSGIKYSSHDGRIVLNTALQNVECDPNWIQMAMGRKVPGNKNPYTKPNIEQLRAKYQKALPELQFLGAGFKGTSDRSAEDEAVLSDLVLAAKAGALTLDTGKLKQYLEAQRGK